MIHTHAMLVPGTLSAEALPKIHLILFLGACGHSREMIATK
jgi:hypothetical protein